MHHHDDPERSIPTQTNDVLTPDERLEESGRFEGSQSYTQKQLQSTKDTMPTFPDPQTRRTQSHHAYTTLPKIAKHADWLIETLHAIVARLEKVLPHIAQPDLFRPKSPSAFPLDAGLESPSGRTNLIVLREDRERRGKAMVGRPFGYNVDILAETDLTCSLPAPRCLLHLTHCNMSLHNATPLELRRFDDIAQPHAKEMAGYTKMRDGAHMRRRLGSSGRGSICLA